MQLRRLLAFHFLAVAGSLATAHASFATAKGLSQIVTPDVQQEGDLSFSGRKGGVRGGETAGNG